MEYLQTLRTMNDKPATIAYGRSPRSSRAMLQGMGILLLIGIVSLLGWKYGKPFIDQQRYLSQERKWHAFFLTPGTVVQTTDPAVIRSLAGSASDVPWGYNANAERWDQVRFLDRWQSLPPLENSYTSVACGVLCLLRSPNGTQRIVSVGTHTVEHFRSPGYEVVLVTTTTTPSSWTPGNRGARNQRGNTTVSVRLSPTDRLTTYAGVRSADEISITLPYSLNDQPGEFLITLNDDGTVSAAVKSGNATLVRF